MSHHTSRSIYEGPSAQKAWVDVLTERSRQIKVEGFEPEHDDAHDPGELAMAAVSYAVAHYGLLYSQQFWPWEPASFKPKNFRRDLVRAAALILAEIERYDRKNQESR